MSSLLKSTNVFPEPVFRRRRRPGEMDANGGHKDNKKRPGKLLLPLRRRTGAPVSQRRMPWQWERSSEDKVYQSRQRGRTVLTYGDWQGEILLRQTSYKENNLGINYRLDGHIQVSGIIDWTRTTLTNGQTINDWWRDGCDFKLSWKWTILPWEPQVVLYWWHLHKVRIS